MSVSQYADLYKPKFVKVTDPVLDLENKVHFPILKGGVETTERNFISNNVSNTNITFSVPPPSPQTFVSRRFIIRLPIEVTLKATSEEDAYAFRPGFDAFKSYPVSTLIQNLEIKINGQSSNLQMNELVKPLLLYHNNDRDLGDRNFSMEPAMRDQSQNYNDLVAAGASDQTYNRNPLNTFVDSMSRVQIPRGAFPYDSITHTYDDENNEVTDVIRATLTEELFLSPLLFGGVEDEGFIGIQKIDINITLINDLTRVWSHASNGSTLANFVVDSVNIAGAGDPSILFRYVTPPIDFKIQPFYQYSYNDIDYYSTSITETINSYAAGGSASETYANIQALGTNSVISNNIQLNSIPRFLYVFVRRKDINYLQTDSYMSIKSISVNWNNNNALLSDATQQQLYDIARKNGVDLDWNQWSGYPMIQNTAAVGRFIAGIGSVLALEFGTDIGLREHEAPGLIGTYNLQVKVNYTNYSGAAIDNLELILLTIVPGIFTIYQNSASKRIGVLDQTDVIMAQEILGFDYASMEKHLMSGGRMFNLKKSFKKLGKLGKKALPLAKELVPKKYRHLVDKAVKFSEEGISSLPQMVKEALPMAAAAGQFVGGQPVGGYMMRRPGRPLGSRNKSKKKRGPGRPRLKKKR